MGDILNSQEVADATKVKKGFLRRLFEGLDLPGNIVQNILFKGNFEGAGRNLVDLVSRVGTLGLAGTNLTRDDKDRPDVGFVGELLTDPLLWLNLPGGAAKNIALQAGKRSALAATSRALTRAGSKAVAKEAAESVLPRLLKSKAAQVMAARVAKAGKGTSEDFLKQLAARRALRSVSKGYLKGELPKFIQAVREPLSQGGVRIGIPFGPGKTVALAGRDVLKDVVKYSLPGQIAKSLPVPIKEGAKNLVKKFAPLAFATPTARRIAERAKNTEGAMKAAWQSRIADALGWMDEGTRKGLGEAMGSEDPAKAISQFVATHADETVRTRLADSVGKWKQITSDMADELASQGFIRDRSKLKEFYHPTQLLDSKRADDILQLLAPAEKTARKVQRSGATTKYLEDRVFKTIEDMRAAGLEPETDILKAGLQRASSQAYMMSRGRAIRQANAVLGTGGGGITDASRLKGGLLPMRSSAAGTGKFESVTIEEGAKRAEHAVADATKAAEGIAPLGVTRPIAGAADRLGEMRGVAQQAAAKATSRTQQVIAATNRFIPKKLRGKMSVKMAPDGSHAALGFTSRKGKPIAMGEMRRAADGVYEISNVSHGKYESALLAAAHQFGAARGVTVRMSDSMFKRYAPKLQELVDKEMSQFLRMGTGDVKPSRFLDFIEKNPYMRVFKSGVTVGLGPLVNVAFVTRNIMTGIFQAATDPQIGLAGFRHIRPVVEGLIDKIGRKFGKQVVGGDVFKMLAEDSMSRGADLGRAVSGIDSVRVGNYTGAQVLDMARKNAVIRQGYTSVEQIMQQAAQKGKKLIPQWANEANEYAENAMRLNGYVTLLKKGVDPESAAQAVSKAFIDYRYQSQTDRTIRSLFPFSRFTMAQTPVTLEASARNPALTQPLRAAMAGGVPPLTPPWLSDAPNIPLGTTEKGDQRVLGRTGLPFEDLSVLGSGEGPARTLEQGVAARLNLLLRLPAELILNKSFYTGREIGGTVRAPQVLPQQLIEALGGKVGPADKGGKRVPWYVDQALRAAPGSRQLAEISKLMDERKPVWSRSLDYIAGAKTYDIDQDRELKRLLRDYLVAQVKKGDLGSVQNFFATGDTSEELTAILKAYYKIGRGSGKRGTKPPSPGATT